MTENLVIVESPAKAKTISGFLGKEFSVKSCYGHIRDLEQKGISVDIENNFHPHYVIPDEKQKVIEDLRKSLQKTTLVWLATDEDREGEAISWHLSEALKLKQDKIRRIVFHEITKPAIMDAIENPRTIDKKLVDAQQARRVLDRLVGYELSPILWKKVKPSLSAGRVQSVTVRLLVEREREINSFKSASGFKITGIFIYKSSDGKTFSFKAEIAKRFPGEKEAFAFLEKLKNAGFTVKSVEKKPSRRTPPPPFITSTLQQEASSKLGFSVAQTMRIAQSLYEAGKITYMRTDSVNLSGFALNAAKNEITRLFGANYVHKRQYKTKSALAQEAHEAIRPTYFTNRTVNAEDDRESRLYDLIWKRTVASQMQDAELEKTVITIAISTVAEEFIATGEVIIFDGYLKVYMESDEEEDDETDKDQNANLLPPLANGQVVVLEQVLAVEKHSQPPPRYTEASLVKKLEALGIGRPSTYAPIISTVQKRGYVVKESRPGLQRKYLLIMLKDGQIKKEIKTETSGSEKAKLFPTDIGMVVNDFLEERFPQIMDYHFTAKVEEEFDDIALGKMNWTDMLKEFYVPFHKLVEKTLETAERVSGERLLGKDPVSGKKIIVRIGRFGPIVQKGVSDSEEKPSFASLRPNQRIETITLENAIELLNMPRRLGLFEEKETLADIGRFGPYVKHDGKFVSIPRGEDAHTVTLERAIQLIEDKRIKDLERTLREFQERPDIKVLKGRWGPYLVIGKENFRIPKNTNHMELSLDDCLKIADAAPKKRWGKKEEKKEEVQVKKKKSGKKIKTT